MLVVLTETYCNKVNIQITQRDDFIQTQRNCFTSLYTGRILAFDIFAKQTQTIGIQFMTSIKAPQRYPFLVDCLRLVMCD